MKDAIEHLITKTEKSFWKYIWKQDALILLGLVMGMILVRNLLYPQEVINVYYGSNRGPFGMSWFITVYKMLMNIRLFKERPLARNIFFDWCRCVLTIALANIFLVQGYEAFLDDAER